MSHRKGKVGGEASQFFAQENDSKNISLQATADKVIDLLNQAQLVSNEMRLGYLKQVQELIINKDPTLLDNFLDEILIFQQDKSSDVRKFVVTFIEDACKKDTALLPKTTGCLVYLLGDDNIAISKRVILACVALYKVGLQLVCKLRTIKEDIRDMWDSMTELKRQICGLIESGNDGVRTSAIKFMEVLILTHSKSSSGDPTKKDDFSLDMIPANHPLVKQSELSEEGITTLEALLALCSSTSISSVNLMAVVSSLTNVAKNRRAFFPTVIQAFESLHANLPPNLTKSQVSSVRKNLKLQLFSLLKLPSSEPFLAQIGTLLTDLGATAAEISKSIPKFPKESQKRLDDNMSMEKFQSKDTKIESTQKFSLSKAIELTTSDIVPRLTKETVTDLVLVSMLFLPRSMPTHFQETFTPIAAAGGTAQVEHLGRLMATQMTNAGLGVGIKTAKQLALNEAKAQLEAREKQARQPKSIPVVNLQEDTSKLKMQLPNKKPRSIRDIAADLKSGTKMEKDGSGTKIRKIKPFRLQDAIVPMNTKKKNEMLLSAYKRILESDKQAMVSGTAVERKKILVGLAMQFYGQLTEVLINFVMEDFRSRIDLGVLWLYQEYVKGEAQAPGSCVNGNSRYALCLKMLLDGIRKFLEPRDKLFTRFILEAPCLSDGVRKAIKEYCLDPDRLMVGFATLRELISKTPAKCQEWLQLLLELTTADREQVRVQAIHSAKKLHSKIEFTEIVEDFALHSLQQLLLDQPPFRDNLLQENEERANEWTEESIKAYLYLYLALLSTNHSLFLNLADVYVESSALIKRTILRHLEHPVRAIGMNSPELLRLVEHCPTGAETLVTRVLHIVTDKCAPAPELVEKVKELYHKRVSDVRFLIPVLNGLAKVEIIEALPKLIAQSANVVKEVFNRLLGSYQDESASQMIEAPLSPAELLVALHTIESKSDVKSVMKAINICFGEKQIYTQEVLAVVIQQLLDIAPLPTLFMRTVIQSLGMCPRLVGFVMNILSKLINKQVWKHPKVWQGFIKCCQMTKPQSFPVLLQLPPKQLEAVMESAADLKEQLVAHMENLSASQRSHVPKQILALFDKDAKGSGRTDESLTSFTISGDKRKRKTEITIKELSKDPSKKSKTLSESHDDKS